MLLNKLGQQNMVILYLGAVSQVPDKAPDNNLAHNAVQKLIKSSIFVWRYLPVTYIELYL